jgi:hypothetical protein
MSKGKKKELFFDDVIVETFKAYPKDFSLPRYEEFPDSDIFRRELYFSLRPLGLIRIAKRKCMLTEDGLERGATLSKSTIPEDAGNRVLVKEVGRINTLKGFQLFLMNQPGEIIDHDLYEFFGFSVRSRPLEVAERVSRLRSVIKKLAKLNPEKGTQITNYMKFLKNRFREYFKETE